MVPGAGRQQKRGTVDGRSTMAATAAAQALCLLCRPEPSTTSIRFPVQVISIGPRPPANVDSMVAFEGQSHGAAATNAASAEAISAYLVTASVLSDAALLLAGCAFAEQRKRPPIARRPLNLVVGRE